MYTTIKSVISFALLCVMFCACMPVDESPLDADTNDMTTGTADPSADLMGGNDTSSVATMMVDAQTHEDISSPPPLDVSTSETMLVADMGSEEDITSADDLEEIQDNESTTENMLPTEIELTCDPPCSQAFEQCLPDAGDPLVGVCRMAELGEMCMYDVQCMSTHCRGGYCVPIPDALYFAGGTAILGSPGAECPGTSCMDSRCLEGACPDPEVGRYPAERQHLTTIAPLFALTHEVTQWGFASRMNMNPAFFNECPGSNFSATCPIENLTALDAIRFANARSTEQGFIPCYDIDLNQNPPAVSMPYGTACGWRLPSSNEWEYLARAGVPGTGFASAEELSRYARFRLNAGIDGLYAESNPQSNCGAPEFGWDTDQKCGVYDTHELRPNDWGLYGMIGNVAEMTWDDGISTLTEVEIRGCSYASALTDCRFSARFTHDGTIALPTVGFRIVMSR